MPEHAADEEILYASDWRTCEERITKEKVHVGQRVRFLKQDDKASGMELLAM
jgi:hypothetical protein